MLKSIGFSLDDINDLLRNGMSVDYIKRLLQVKKSEIEDRIHNDKSRLRQVDIWLDNIHREGTMPEQIYIQKKTVPAIRVVSKREIGTYEETIAKLTKEILWYIDHPEKQGTIKIDGPVMGLFYDDEYKETDADIEVAMPITGEWSFLDPELGDKILPEREVITAVHKGFDQNIGKTYAQIMEYAEENGLLLQAPVCEIYLTYWENIPEEDYITEIQCPFREAVR